MTLNFVIPEMVINNDEWTLSPFRFYRRGFNLGSGGSQPSWKDIILHGNTALTLVNAKANGLNYLKLFGGTEQRNLPVGYTQTAYTYFNVPAYLTTNFVPTYDCKVEFEFKTGSSIVNNATTYLGARPSSTGNGGLRVAHITSGVWRIYGFGAYADSTDLALPNTEYKFVYDNGHAVLTTGDIVVFDYTFTTTEENTYPVTINGWNSAGTVTVGAEPCYIYKLKCWDNQGNLSLDYVPATYNTSVGFYNNVDNSFKTATAGTLDAGGVATPTPDTPMNIVSNNGALKARHQSGLPLGYTRLEYIESTGTQYIDTGIKQQDGDEFGLVYQQVTLDTSYRSLFGASVSGTAGSLYISQTSSDTWAGNVRVTSLRPDTNKHTLSWTVSSSSDQSIVIDEINYNIAVQIIPNADLSVKVFARNETQSKMIGKVYGYYQKRNGEYLINLVPAKDSNNVIGMYDLVSGQFFTNQGTDTFTAGNTVSGPVEIYTDGTVETVAIQYPLDLPTTNTFGNITESFTYSYNVNADTVALPVTIGKKYIIKWTNTTQATVGSVFRYGFVDNSTPAGQAVTQGFRGTIQNLPSNPIIVTADNSYLLLQCNQNYTIPNITNGYLTVYEVAGSATAEMLLGIGDYQDEQNVTNGNITRNVGILVLDGVTTGKMFSSAWNATYKRCNLTIPDMLISVAATKDAICNLFPYSSSVNTSPTSLGFCTNNGYLLVSFIGMENITSANDANTWLAQQYNAGTPVIVIYPLATPTTETVTPQQLTIQAGTNIVEITQASIDNLELEVSYKAEVSVTVTEIENAQLDNSVEVTVNG